MSIQKRPGDWICPNCNFLIFASKKACKKCGAMKPDGAKSGKRGGSDKRGKRTGKSHGDEWICSNCSSSNYADRAKCRKCRTDRADTSIKKDPHDTAPKKSEKRDKSKKEWLCTECNTSNYTDRDKCRKCDSLQPKSDERKQDEDTIVPISAVSIKLNIEIEMKLKELKSTNKVDVDLVFLMDCTGSMGNKINAAKQTIRNIINDLKNDADSNINNINFGYIAYRDQPKSESTFITKVFPLTSDVNKMYGYIDSYGASGGGDGPEALTEVLHDSLTKMKYNDNNMKMNILICDAPGHGWGCTTYDSYPNGNPNGYDPIKLCYEMSKRGIILYILGCEPSISYYVSARDILEGMAKITEGYYLPLTNADLLPDIICNSLKQELNLKFIEKFIINMMIKIRMEKNQDIDDSEKLLNALDLNVIKQLQMNDKMKIGNVYKGDYDYTNINLICNTQDDEKKQNMNYVLQNIKKIKQPEIMRFSTKSKFEMKSGDWNCTKCHYHNFANRWFCRTCNNVNHTLKNGDWLCTKCDDINFAKNKLCRKCKVTKKPKDGPHIIKKDKEEKEHKQEIENVNCLVNDDLCNVVLNRIKKQRRFHDWKCKKCDYINFESNQKCRKCDVAKSDNFGDWKCDG